MNGDPARGRQDRDVMLSPVLLEELRAHWRRLRKRCSVWLFPGNRWHSGDRPIDTKTPATPAKAQERNRTMTSHLLILMRPAALRRRQSMSRR